MFKKLWILFCQATTVGLALLFITSAFKPEWLPARWSRSAPAPSLTPGAPSGALTAPPPLAGTHAVAASSAGILSYADAAKRATPAVVNIYTTKAVRQRRNPFSDDPLFKRFFGDRAPEQSQQSNSLGSGVIVRNDGMILTNHHVVDGADEIEVLLSDGRRGKAKLVGSDPDTDLAVLKTELTNLPTIDFAAVEQSRIGDVVLAIGNPFGVGQTVTMGIVSALGRSQLGINTFENFIQTDAAINPGNSGGALVDTKGNLLGINTAIYSRSGGSLGIGFAIPSTTAQQVMQDIITKGTVTRGFIGVEPQDITPEMVEAFKLPRQEGAIITRVLSNGPADTAGIKPGDIIVSIEGQAIKDTAQLLNTIAKLVPGQKASITTLRDKTEKALTVVIGTRPKQSAPKRED
jgi:serine protease DegQ